MKHIQCVHTSHYLYSKLNKIFHCGFVLPLYGEKKTQKTAVNWCRRLVRQPRFMCLHWLCSCRGSWVFPHYLILIVPLMEGSRSLTVFCQNHKTSSLQQWMHVHVHINLEGSFSQKVKQIFSFCHLHKFNRWTVVVQFSLWMNSELTFKSFLSWDAVGVLAHQHFHLTSQCRHISFTPPQENSCLLTLFNWLRCTMFKMFITFCPTASHI